MSTDLKSYDGLTKWMYFLNEDDSLLEKYNIIWNTSALILKKKLTVNMYTIKLFFKAKQNVTVMKQVFIVKKYLK